MYLHLGQDVVVPLSSLIGVFDIENTTQSKITLRFLEDCQRAGSVVNISEELPKSFAVCCEDGKTTVYISQISAQTLFKRCKNASGWQED